MEGLRGLVVVVSDRLKVTSINQQTTADKRQQVEPEPEMVQQQQTLDPEQHTEPDPSCSRIGRSKCVFCSWKKAEIR